MQHKIIILLSLVISIAACTTEGASQIIPATEEPQQSPTEFVVATAINTLTPTETAEPISTNPPTPFVIDAATWKEWTVIPKLSSEMLAVYAAGQEMGRDAHVVSVIGDCESSSDWFLKDFSKGERYYDLGPYTGLQETINYFSTSLGYQSYAALRGATAITVLAPLWADPKVCDPNETPLACEYRLHNPSFALIALGTNDVTKLDQFEPKMHTIIEYTLEQGIVPILVTKADNSEGDESINLTIAKLSGEYHLPVWNFWAAVQPLPDHGLQDDGVHLTFGSNFFNEPHKLDRAWPMRNLTALQVLEAMRLAVQEK